MCCLRRPYCLIVALKVSDVGHPSVYYSSFWRIPLWSANHSRPHMKCACNIFRWITELLRQPLLPTVVAQVYNFFEVLENMDLNESKSSMRRHTPGRVHFEVITCVFLLVPQIFSRFFCFITQIKIDVLMRVASCPKGLRLLFVCTIT